MINDRVTQASAADLIEGGEHRLRIHLKEAIVSRPRVAHKIRSGKIEAEVLAENMQLLF
jgi:hypothetical protein